MKLQWAHLCDHATMLLGGKVAVIGIFDVIAGEAGSVRPIVVPHCMFVASIARSTVDPVVAVFNVRLLDPDGNSLADFSVENVNFVPSVGHGVPICAAIG